jgi:hypothetical protein
MSTNTIGAIYIENCRPQNLKVLNSLEIHFSQIQLKLQIGGEGIENSLMNMVVEHIMMLRTY